MPSSEVTLTADPAAPPARPRARRLRREDKVPGVVYGQGAGTRRVTVVRRELRIALSAPAGLNAAHHARGRRRPRSSPSCSDLQRDPIAAGRHPRRLPPHQPRRGDHRRGADPSSRARPKEVLRNDGLVEQSLDHLTVIAKPGDIPTVVHDRRLRRSSHRRRRSACTTSRCPRASPRRSTPTSRRHRQATRAAIEDEEAEGEEGEGGEGEGGRRCRRVGGERRQRRRLTHPVPPRRLRARAGRRPTSWSSVSATPAKSSRAAGTTSAPRSVELLAERHGGTAASGRRRGHCRRGDDRGQACGARVPADLHEPVG